ncbi:SDR family oxidoreductase [Terrihabitans rhizophilus]|uniref:SDR family oxidoreductase n=1 Tax=Terrihabitans rhizophilus TaxID=3092662 RepID=A0ABU4RJQ6_9HYPH|nr:SDR family oxidoreductase [Terrihabitans sp. PJ23]MDX6805071.1 SDR family oxidoreductase [Terrihabitans sp. PJ23]
MEHANKAAIVTGASRGIGAAIAERLARDGFAVTINYAGSEAPARELAERINASGGRAIAVQADVADAKAVARLFDETERAFGGVDAIVNNAGIMTLAPLAEATDEQFDAMVATNLKGVFNGMRAGGRRIRDGGRVVNFSTSVVGMKLPGYGIYAATKAAVETLTHIMAKELGPKRITVNTVAPGPVATELFLGGKTEEQVAGLTRLIPLGRLGEPEDIAGVVSFLLGPDGGWVNGQVIRANGGVV